MEGVREAGVAAMTTTEGDGGTKEHTFASLGLAPELVETVAGLGYKKPTPIQVEAIPLLLAGRDVIGLAQTGSGKTAAFLLPILHGLLAAPQSLAAVVLSPTRELALQIAEQAGVLGAGIGLRVATLVGGQDSVSQAVALSKKPHVIVGTPGRVLDHLEHTRGFALPKLRYLVLDEADRLLNMDFGPDIDRILAAVRREGRQTMLFSATMTGKVAKLQRASLTDPVRVDVSGTPAFGGPEAAAGGDAKYVTNANLVQTYIFLPAKTRDATLFWLLADAFAGAPTIVFVATCAAAQRLAVAARHLGLPAVPLHGQLTQAHRLAALGKFRRGERTVLFATDVASRGLDIPAVDVVVNYDVPANSKDYVHRVGRTARAGRPGRSVCMVTQYDVELYQRIEQLIGRRLDAHAVDREAVAVLQGRVQEALRAAHVELKAAEEAAEGARGPRGRKRPIADADERVEYVE